MPYDKVSIEYIRETLLSSFWKFVRFMNIKKNGKVIVPNVPLYKEVCKKISRLDKNTLILLPRRHLKTLTVSLFLLWYILKFPNNAVTVICENKDKAKRLLRGIRSLITKNRNFKMIFGTNILAKTDNDKYLLTLANRETTAKEVNIQVYGVEQNIQSTRADLMLWEDVIGKDFIKSKANRENIFTAWEHSDAILEANSKIIVTGTRYTTDDLYQHIIDENEETEEWNTTIYGIYNEDGRVLCSYVMSKDEIELKKKKHKPSFFSAQYLNKPINDEINIFNLELYQRYTGLPKIEYVFIAIDLSDGDGGDKNAFAIVGKSVDNSGTSSRYYLLDAYGNNRIDSENFYYVIRKFYNRYSEKCLSVIVELNRNGKTICRDTFNRLKKKHNDSIPFTGIYNIEKKNIRIEKLEPMLRTGELILPSKQNIKEGSGLSYLLDELRDFNYTINNNQDDLIDSLSMCIVAMQRRESIKENQEKKKKRFIGKVF